MLEINLPYLILSLTYLCFRYYFKGLSTNFHNSLNGKNVLDPWIPSFQCDFLRHYYVKSTAIGIGI